jgi:hypothetical protein
VSPWHDFSEFQQHIGKIEKKRRKPSVFLDSLIINTNFDLATLAVTRLQAIITTFLLRRMKDSKLDGKRLIELPEKNVGMIRLEFSPEERDIYRMVNVDICTLSVYYLYLNERWKSARKLDSTNSSGQELFSSTE